MPYVAAAHALADGINHWRAANIPLDRLLDEAATPGGVAATTMSAMDKAGHRRAVEKGLQAVCGERGRLRRSTCANAKPRVEKFSVTSVP